jgi:hypothetical protein
MDLGAWRRPTAGSAAAAPSGLRLPRCHTTLDRWRLPALTPVVDARGSDLAELGAVPNPRSSTVLGRILPSLHFLDFVFKFLFFQDADGGFLESEMMYLFGIFHV